MSQAVLEITFAGAPDAHQIARRIFDEATGHNGTGIEYDWKLVRRGPGHVIVNISAPSDDSVMGLINALTVKDIVHSRRVNFL